MKQLKWILPLLLFGCAEKSQSPKVQISLTGDKKALQLSGLDPAILNELARDSSVEVWQGLAAVYRMPADTELKSYQPVQPGRYKVRDSLLVFTPDTPFAAGQTYFLRYHRFSDGKTTMDYLRGSRRLNSPPYTDLIFKQ